MMQRSRSSGFTLIELVVVLAIVAVLAALLTMLMSALVKTQRLALLRARQRTEYARLDAILRNDVHAATAAVSSDATKCALTNQQGLQLSYELSDGSLHRRRHDGEAWATVDRFYLRPGTEVNFRIVQDKGRSLVELHLDLLTDDPAAGARQAPYRGQMLVGGGSPAAHRVVTPPTKEQP